MRELSPRTRKLVESLYAPRKWNLFGRRTDGVSLQQFVDEASTCREIALIPELLPLVVGRDREKGAACAEVIDGIVRRLRPEEILQFESDLHEGSDLPFGRLEPWAAINVPTVEGFARFGRFADSLLASASCHRNGYVRERAVRLLGGLQSGFELPFLLLRITDWVEQVRSAATALVLSRIQPDRLGAILDHHVLLDRIKRATRNDHSQVMEALERALDTELGHQVLLKQIASPVSDLQKYGYDKAFAFGLLDSPEHLIQALKNADVRIRIAAVRRLTELPADPRLMPALEEARKDSLMSVRRAALRICAAKYPNDAGKYYQNALLDGHASIRQEARAFLQSHGVSDFRGYYLPLLKNATGARLAKIVAGVGETGISEDAELVANLAADGRVQVRYAALRALTHLGPAKYIELFVVHLDDESRRVSRQALTALTSYARQLGGTRVWEIFRSCHQVHGKRAALYLIARLSKWDSIPLLLKSLGETSEALNTQSRAYIARWYARYNRSFEVPSKEQIAHLQSALDSMDYLLKPKFRTEFAGILKSISR